MTSFSLITTGHAQTLPQSGAVLLLGGWCDPLGQLVNRADIKLKIAKPYGLKKYEKDRDYALCKKIKDDVFPHFCEILNFHLEKSFEERAWNIILGHWFFRMTSILINRYSSLRQCLDNYSVDQILALSHPDFNLGCEDTYTQILHFETHVWNSLLDGKIASEAFDDEATVTLIKMEDFDNSEHEDLKQIARKNKKKLNQTLRLAYGTLYKLLCNGHLAPKKIIVNPYLPRTEEIRLNLRFGQIPLLHHWDTKLSNSLFDVVLRNKLSANLANKKCGVQERIIRKFLFQLLPSCFLEGFPEVEKKIQKTGLPKKPELIFTSNCFDTDEIFKIWVANCVSNGSRYFVGQHGANYGTSRYMNPSVEEQTSDKFLTWGWQGTLKQHQPCFLLKGINDIGVLPRLSGDRLSLFQIHCPHRMETWDTFFEHSQYFLQQKQFIAGLDDKIRSVVTVRLHPESQRYKFNDLERWRDWDPLLNVDLGKSNQKKIQEKSRLLVFSYDSAGFLESLAANRPTLAFWNNGLDHLRDSCKENYRCLERAGLIFFSPDDISCHINLVWKDLEIWWNTDEVQEARLKFCHLYARTVKDRLRILQRILEER